MPRRASCFPQRVTVVATVSDEAGRFFCPRTARPGVAALRGSVRERRLPRAGPPRGKPREGGSPRGRPAPSDHHHPLRPLAPAWFCRRQRPFFGPGAKLPSRNASLQFSCWRSCNSPRKARQDHSQILPAPPSPATVATRLWATETPRANPASEPRCAQDPQNAFQHFAVVGPRPPPCGGAGVVWEQGLDLGPLGVRSATDRIAPHAPPWRCSLPRSPPMEKTTTCKISPFVQGFDNDFLIRFGKDMGSRRRSHLAVCRVSRPRYLPEDAELRRAGGAQPEH